MYQNKHTKELASIVRWSGTGDNVVYMLSNNETWEYHAFWTNWEAV